MKPVLSVLLVLLPAALRSPAQSPERAPAIERAAAVVEPAELEETLSFLASDAMRGRNTPSPELDRAADWLAARFRAIGVPPAFGESYFQGPRRGVREKASGTLRAGRRALPLGSAAFLSAGNGRLTEGTLETVAVPLPRRRSEVPGEDLVRGRAALLVPRDGRGFANAGGRRVRMAARWLAGAGASALLVPASLSLDAGRWRSHALPVVEVDPAALPVEPGGGARLLPDVRLELAVPRAVEASPRNVGGLITGSDAALRDEVIVFSAHYDHIGARPEPEGGEDADGVDRIFNGADDNASGTTAVLAIARAFRALPEPPRRSVLFLLFFGEEKGFLGSRHYCEHPARPLGQTKAVFNLEMVGRPDDIEADSAWVTGWEQSDFGEIIAESGRRAGIRFYDRRPLGRRLFFASDNLPFARKGVPAHSISAGSLHEDYHRPGDEARKIDYGNMARVVRGIFTAGAVMAGGGRVPSWKPGSRFAREAGGDKGGGGK